MCKTFEKTIKSKRAQEINQQFRIDFPRSQRFTRVDRQTVLLNTNIRRRFSVTNSLQHIVLPYTNARPFSERITFEESFARIARLVSLNRTPRFHETSWWAAQIRIQRAKRVEKIILAFLFTFLFLLSIFNE